MTPPETRAAFLRLIRMAAETEQLRKLIFSKPYATGAQKITCRLSVRRGRTVLLAEEMLPDGKVRHLGLTSDEMDSYLAPLSESYGEINLLTPAGDAVLRNARGGTATVKGMVPLSEKLKSGGLTDSCVTPPDREKAYLIPHDTPFLTALGISDRNGRVHDRMQGKFRQINRFVELLADVYTSLPGTGTLSVYDLCCGKSYLSFAVYHYLSRICGRDVDMLCIDRKADVVDYCRTVAQAAGFDDMRFVADDIRNTPSDRAPDLVISLHACDIATDLVLKTAVRLGAGVILSTPCCHRNLSRHLNAPALNFAAAYPQLRGKLCDALTDGLRLLYLRKEGYRVTAAELVDPESTPKNTLLRGIRDPSFCKDSPKAAAAEAEYRQALLFLMGDDASAYLEALQ